MNVFVAEEGSEDLATIASPVMDGAERLKHDLKRIAGFVPKGRMTRSVENSQSGPLVTGVLIQMPSPRSPSSTASPSESQDSELPELVIGHKEVLWRDTEYGGP